jgi:hypothetical protein
MGQGNQRDCDCEQRRANDASLEPSLVLALAREEREEKLSLSTGALQSRQLHERLSRFAG